MNLATNACDCGWLSGTATAVTVCLKVSSSTWVPGIFFAIGVLGQEGDIPSGFCGRVGDLSGILERDVFHGYPELRSHRLAEIDGHASIAGLGLGRPERTAGRADRNRHPQLAGRRQLIF